MGDLVNLRRARKAKVRDERTVEAEQNRLRFGRPLVERRAQAAAEEKASRALDGHCLAAPSTGDDV